MLSGACNARIQARSSRFPSDTLVHEAQYSSCSAFSRAKKSLCSRIAVGMPRWTNATLLPATVRHDVVPPDYHPAGPSSATSSISQEASYNPADSRRSAAHGPFCPIPPSSSFTADPILLPTLLSLFVFSHSTTLLNQRHTGGEERGRIQEDIVSSWGQLSRLH